MTDSREAHAQVYALLLLLPLITGTYKCTLVPPRADLAARALTFFKRRYIASGSLISFERLDKNYAGLLKKY